MKKQRIRDQVHAALKANPGITIADMAKLLGLSNNAAYMHLRHLRAAGLACNKGSTTGGSTAGAGTACAGEWHLVVETRVASVWDLAAQP